MQALLTFILLASAGSPGADAGKQLAAAAKSGGEARICELLAQVGAEPSKATVQVVLQLGAEHPSHKVYEAVRQALAAVRGADAIEAIGKTLAQQTNARMRTLALFALEDIPVATTVEHLTACLKDKNLALAMHAARALGRKPMKSAVTALVGIVPAADKASPEYSLIVRQALYQLTGQNIRVAEDWAKWWAKEQEVWEPGLADSGRGRTWRGFKPPVALPRFFGVEVESVRVVFVIDISGSMEEPAVNLDISRMELVKQELARTIEDLRPETRFTVIAFNSKIVPMWPSLYAATPQNIAKAVKWVRGLAPRSTTWTQEALEAAFGIKEANAIVLLSDGSPCKGAGVLPTKPILDWVERANRFRRVAVHTISFRDAFLPFLRSLARQNGGTCRNARPDAPVGEGEEGDPGGAQAEGVQPEPEGGAQPDGMEPEPEGGAQPVEEEPEDGARPEGGESEPGGGAAAPAAAGGER